MGSERITHMAQKREERKVSLRHIPPSPHLRINGSPLLSLSASTFFLAFFVLSMSAFCEVRSQTPAKTSTGIDAASASKYVGRYELESGIIPISTLDVFYEENELWIKPSVSKKRRMISQPNAPTSTGVFLDEISGTVYTFNRDEQGKIVSLIFQYEGAEYTAQRIVLPQPSLKGNTTFRLKGHDRAKVVVLSGSFNNWNQSQYVFGREGDEWVCRIDLEPGRHSYKFIVDGKWILDPANPDTEDDDYGVKNSLINVVKAQ